MNKEELEQKYENLQNRCKRYQEEHNCGFATLYTMGCNECVIANMIRGIRKRINSLP